MKRDPHLSAFFSSLIFLTLLSPTSTLDTLFPGSFLSVEKESDVLFSPDGTFSCGFHSVGTNAYTFSIWFSVDQTVVWTANRDHPVNGKGSRASFRRGGSMVLTDLDDSVVWITNTSSASVDRAELLNTGNLALKDLRGNILWQSFDSPTDTLLPGQPITKTIRLVSAISKRSVSSGLYSLFYDSDNVLRLMYDGPEISSVYWPNPDYLVFGNGRTNYNSSRRGVLNEMGQFVSSDKLSFYASDMGSGIRRRLTIDYDGNLRLYSLESSTSTWSVTWQALVQQCRVHGLCGRNGICTYKLEARCSCPPGYEMADPSDWNRGCTPKFERNSCGDPKKWKFAEVPYTDFYGYDLNHTESISYHSCRKMCDEDCSCQAFVYRNNGDGSCFPKSALFNGYSNPDFPGTLYMKVPMGLETSNVDLLKVYEPICSNSSSKSDVHTAASSQAYDVKRKRGFRWVYIYAFVSALGAIEFLFIASGWWFLSDGRRKPTPMEEGYQALSNQFRKFTYKDLKRATRDFKEELGRGASGQVYKGELDNKRIVAVKKLASMDHGEEEFRAELSVIGKIYHMNLVRMWGFCLERTRRLLVYEYVENGSLDKALFNESGSPLEWTKRFGIALGTAKGLAYLHHECLEWIIHCDIKPENILLEDNYEPKIADFGLVKLLQRDGPVSNISTVRGTKGYMAPEWTSNVPITAKVDVYSYGVILLELVKGSRLSTWVVDGGEEVETRVLVRALKGRLMSREEDGDWIGNFVDPRLNGQFNRRQATSLLEMAVSCLEEERNKRPAMDSVVQTLVSCEAISEDYSK